MADRYVRANVAAEELEAKHSHLNKELFCGNETDIARDRPKFPQSWQIFTALLANDARSFANNANSEITIAGSALQRMCGTVCQEAAPAPEKLDIDAFADDACRN